MTLTPEQIAKSREEFHEHCIKNGFSIEMHDGGYLNLNTFRFWHIWLARKESLVIELPQDYVDYDQDDNPCRFFTKKQIIHMLQSAGINYREKE